MTERTYVAVLDDGHDYIDFEFESCHNANSKANKEDCKFAYQSRYGLKEAARIDWSDVHTWRKGK